jgi:integrase
MDGFTPIGNGIPAATGFAPTLADVIAQITTWTDMEARAQRDLTSAVRVACRMIGQPPENIPADPAYLNEVLFRRSPAALGIGAGARAAIVSRVRRALRSFGTHAPLHGGTAGLDPAWRGFLSLTGCAVTKGVLLGLAHWAQERGRGPGDLAASDIQAFCDQDRATRLSPSAASREAIVGRAWMKTVAAHPDPERFAAYRAPSKRKPYVRPLSDFPPSFQEDVRRFEHSLGRGAETAPFSATNRRSLRPATIDLRVFALRQAASVLVMSGEPIERLQGLRDLVTPPSRPARVLDHFYAKAGGKLNGQIWNIAETLRQIAKHHVGLPADECDRLRTFTRRIIASKPQGISGKVRERLKELTHRPNLIRLLNLPEHLIRSAQDPTLLDAEQARLMRSAAMIELLTFAPLRLANARSLRIAENLMWIGSGGERHICLRIEGAETKNGDSIDWPLPPSTSRLLERYIDKARPILAKKGNPYLFPGKAEEAIDDVTFYLAVRSSTLRHVGVAVHPHLMRHFAAWLFLQANPGAYEVVRRILGHRKIETTINHYCGLETDAAASALQQAVVRSRDETRLEAKATFAARRAGVGSRRGTKAGSR